MLAGNKCMVLLGIAVMTSIMTSGCAQPENVSERISDNMISVENSDSNIIVQEQNYTIIENDTTRHYEYYVFDDKGSLLDKGSHENWEPSFHVLESGLLKLVLGAGTYANNTKYYDLELHLFSDIIQNPVAERKNLVAYFDVIDDQPLLVIRDIFNERNLCRTFPMDALLSEFPEHAEFISDSEFTITYRTSDLTDVVTETVDF